jgi:glycosyltransferase involved in cell wall biosynthesis
LFSLFQFITTLPLRLFQGLLLTYLAVAVPLRAMYWWVRLLGLPAPTRDYSDPHFDVICFSHVPWSHIWQRNHHTMTRLAKGRKVIYFQTTSIAYIHWFVRNWPHALKEYNNTFPGITLIYPLLFPGQSRLPFIALLNRWLMTTQMRWLEHREGMRNTVLWFYYPACANVLDNYNPASVVYDIQDEYTAFDWSPGDIAQRERYLIDRADVIFAGTHALYERKTSGFQGKAFFYPCAVEFSHFFAAAPAFDDNFFAAHPEISHDAAETMRRIKAAFVESGEGYGTVSAGTISESASSTGKYHPARVSEQYLSTSAGRSGPREPADLRGMARPRLIYVGLIDKRIDPDLLAYLGQAHPEWEIVMVGPVDEKLFDEKSVEQAAGNVHFVGSVKYPRLPQWLAHCDVYLMPWKVNDLTRHINPTKTLEYMAAARPVVSISLPDLENLFSDSVCLATTPDDFVRECEEALAGHRWDKVARGLERAWSFAWEAVVREMEDHVQESIAARHAAKPVANR